MTLGEVLGSEEEGESFAEILAHWDAGKLTNSHKNEAEQRAGELRGRVAAAGTDLERWRFWEWLASMTAGKVERHTASFF